MTAKEPEKQRHEDPKDLARRPWHAPQFSILDAAEDTLTRTNTIPDGGQLS